MNLVQKLFGKKESAAQVSTAKPGSDKAQAATMQRAAGNARDLQAILAGAGEVSWSSSPDVIGLKEAIKNTWNVNCQPLQLTPEQAEAIRRMAPPDANLKDLGLKYQVGLSSNAIFVHSYGAWLNLGYVMFLYHNKLYHVNVAPDVQLITQFYSRTDDLSHMAKIMIALNKHIGSQRDTLLIRLEGDLVQAE